MSLDRRIRRRSSLAAQTAPAIADLEGEEGFDPSTERRSDCWRRSPFTARKPCALRIELRSVVSLEGHQRRKSRLLQYPQETFTSMADTHPLQGRATSRLRRQRSWDPAQSRTHEYILRFVSRSRRRPPCQHALLVLLTQEETVEQEVHGAELRTLPSFSLRSTIPCVCYSELQSFGRVISRNPSQRWEAIR
jgi:hypothetical protein